MKPLPGQKELPLVIYNQMEKYKHPVEVGDCFMSNHELLGKQLAKLFLKYDDKPTSEMWIEILRLSRELVK